MNVEKYFEEIAQFELLAKKEVGQNFLIDPSKAKAIIDALDIQEGEKVLEIGCGAGSLSYFLSFGPGKSDLIDIDEAMVLKTQNDFKGNEFVFPQMGNAMRFDYSSYDKIVGNLPYYITSGILERVLLHAKKARKAVFMVQKEVIDRVFAGPKTKDYSPLNILLSLRGKTRRLFNVSRHSFAPAPHVDSAVFEIEFYEGFDFEEGKKLYSLCKSLFLQRRKTIYNNLKTLLHDGEKAEKILASCSIEKMARPEELEPKDYRALLANLD